ncbi:MAG: YtxH domain-containing protein [Armatimonadota bacterium]|nr:MAG: YtxH domain-containing protein [Armatimonadota bacterium]
MSDRDNDCGVISFLVGVGLGAAAAAAAVILYAPKPGAEIRGDLAEATKELRSRADKVAEQVRGTVRDLGDRVKEDLDTAVATAKEAAAARRAELEQKVKGE